MTALYLHIPFCRRRCGYCAFDSIVAPQGFQHHYLQMLRAELQQLRRWVGTSVVLDSLFVGGGTPTAIGASHLASLVRFCLEFFVFHSEKEITVEVNPGSIERDGFRLLAEAGVNRISLGVQSLVDKELVLLERIHDAQQATNCYQAVRDGGISTVSIDLMYGLPGQTARGFARGLELAMALRPDHLSLYQLSLEEGTDFHRRAVKGKLTLPSEETILQMDEISELVLGDAGLIRYEISNYCQPGCQCRHNLVYWHNDDYLAAGAGAVSCINGLREKRFSDPQQYIDAMQAGVSPIEEREQLDHETRFRETVIMGLRLIDGVEISALAKRFSINLLDYYGDTLSRLIDKGFVSLEKDRLCLTTLGLPLANQIMAELV